MKKTTRAAVKAAKEKPREALSSVFSRLKFSKSPRPVLPVDEELSNHNIGGDSRCSGGANDHSPRSLDDPTNANDHDKISHSNNSISGHGGVVDDAHRSLNDPGGAGSHTRRSLSHLDNLEVHRHYTLDPHWINIEEIQQWLATCDSIHVGECHSPTSQAASRPLWLVDVVRECIVPALEHRYVALSYVWGGVESAQTTKDNIDFLQVPGSLSASNTAIVVPRTIRHAIGLVRLLGEEYLWVDRFCICQDDAASKHSQLQLMGDFYDNAYCTIIAANGWDAYHGLRGIKGVTERRELSPHLDSRQYMEYMNPANSIWYSRGWTFQELVFSRRSILFQQQMVEWECQCSVWHESTGVSGQLPGQTYTQNLFPTTSNHRRNWRIDNDMLERNPMWTYFSGVRSYNIRNLTFPEDGLSAFLGVLNRLTPAFPQGFFWGLPISKFDSTLLWVPVEEITRRQPRGLSSSPLPSWSWVGWQGGIDSGWSAMASSMPLKPLCSWRAWQGSELCDISKLSPASLISPSSPLLVTSALVARTWLSFSYNRLWSMRPSRQPGGPRQNLSPIDRDESIHLNRGIVLISSSTTLQSEQGFQEYELVAISIFQGEAFSGAKGSFREDLKFLKGLHPKGAAKEGYVNVMLVDRKDGVAYRKGLGIMVAEDWEGLDSEFMDITIG